MWEIWNEPNLRRFLKPNSPALYVRRLLNPTYAVLKRTRLSNRIAGGATSPRRTPSGLSPVAFMRGMRAAHGRLDAYLHHPYPVTRGERPSGFARGVCKYCKGLLTLANLPVLLKEVRRDFGPKRIWLTEYGYQTNPPDRFGVSRSVQAKYVAQAALRAKSARFVDVLIHFVVRDAPDRPVRPARPAHDDLGPGAPGQGTALVPAAAAGARPLGLDRPPDPDQRLRLLHPRDPRPAGDASARALPPGRPRVGREGLDAADRRPMRARRALARYARAGPDAPRSARNPYKGFTGALLAHSFNARA
jgi:hypothetical protein